MRPFIANVALPKGETSGNGQQELGINSPSPPAKNPLPKGGEGR